MLARFSRFVSGPRTFHKVQELLNGATIISMRKSLSVLTLGLLVLFAIGLMRTVTERGDFSTKNPGLAAVTAVAKKKDCALTPRPREFNAAPYYEGPLIDAHLHMPVSSSIVAAVGRRMGFEHMPSFGGTLTPDYLACLLKGEGIKQTIGFFLMTRFSLGAEVRTAANFQKNYPGLIAPFFMPGTNDTLRISTSTAKSTLQKNKGLFKGIGEIKMFDNGSIFRPVFLAHYDLAKEQKIPVMLHPFHEHKSEVIRLLERYPEVRFLFHGGDEREWIMEIIKRFPNSYRSIDDVFALYGWGPEHRDKKPSKEEFVAYFRGHFNTLLAKALAEWKPRIEAYPNRFMWGTDRWYDWHFDYEVGGLLTEFGRAFIGRLSPAVQEKFAYKNAERLLERR